MQHSARPRRIHPASILLLVLVLAAMGAGAAWWRDESRMVPVPPSMGPSSVTMDQTYVEKGRGQVQVVLPEVYELLNVVAVLGESPDLGSRVAGRTEPYYAEVMAHFGPYRDHPLVGRLAEYSQQRGYAITRTAFAYRFDGDAIVEGDYRGIKGFLSENVTLFEDFARQSGFRQFFREHQAFYDAWVKEYRERVPVQAMWSWLDREFLARYQGLKVVLSPLVGGNHNTLRFRDRTQGYEESVMFVGSNRTWDREGIPRPVANGLLAMNLFTEIDHNYVNPMTDLHYQALLKAMPRFERWNAGREGSIPQYYYGSAYETFNEYMTFAVHAIYVHETYSGAVREQILNLESQMMATRGFNRYDEFVRRLLELRRQHPGTTVAALYPEIMEMVKEMDRE